MNKATHNLSKFCMMRSFNNIVPAKPGVTQDGIARQNEAYYDEACSPSR